MTTQSCDGCGTSVSIAGGIANLWSFSGQSTDGMILEFEDGSEHFLCYECIERLPDHPGTGHVAALSE